MSSPSLRTRWPSSRDANQSHRRSASPAPLITAASNLVRSEADLSSAFAHLPATASASIAVRPSSPLSNPTFRRETSPGGLLLARRISDSTNSPKLQALAIVAEGALRNPEAPRQLSPAPSIASPRFIYQQLTPKKASVEERLAPTRTLPPPSPALATTNAESALGLSPGSLVDVPSMSAPSVMASASGTPAASAHNYSGLGLGLAGIYTGSGQSAIISSPRRSSALAREPPTNASSGTPTGTTTGTGTGSAGGTPSRRSEDSPERETEDHITLSPRPDVPRTPGQQDLFPEQSPEDLSAAAALFGGGTAATGRSPALSDRGAEGSDLHRRALLKRPSLRIQAGERLKRRRTEQELAVSSPVSATRDDSNGSPSFRIGIDGIEDHQPSPQWPAGGGIRIKLERDSDGDPIGPARDHDGEQEDDESRRAEAEAVMTLSCFRDLSASPGPDGSKRGPGSDIDSKGK